MDLPDVPPPGADTIVWTLARQILADHPGRAGGFCPTCRPLVLWPCDPVMLAEGVLAGQAETQRAARPAGA